MVERLKFLRLIFCKLQLNDQNHCKTNTNFSFYSESKITKVKNNFETKK